MITSSVLREYKTIHATFDSLGGFEGFDKTVMKYLADGWELHGPLAMSERTLAQVVVRSQRKSS